MLRFISITLVITGSVNNPTYAQNQTPPNLGPSAPVTLTATLPCQWKLDGKPQGTLSPGTNLHVRIDVGKHLLEAVSNDPLDTWQQYVEVKDTEEMAIMIDLAHVRTSRFALEALPAVMRTIEHNVALWGAGKVPTGQVLSGTVEVSRVVADPASCRLSWHSRGASKPRDRDHYLDLAHLNQSAFYMGVRTLGKGKTLEHPAFELWPAQHDAADDEENVDVLLFRDELTAEQTLAALKEAISICSSRE